MMLDVCRNAKRCGLDLTFVATGGGELENEFRESGVNYIRLNRTLPIDLSLASQLRKLIAELNIQVVHGHQPIDGLHLYLATRNTRVKRVLTVHGLYPGAKNEVALRLIIPRLDSLVMVSNDLLRRLAEKGVARKRNTLVIRNGVDPERLKTSGDDLRHELGMTTDEILLAMVANFHPVAQKDQVTVCKALPQVFQQLPGSRFIFVGGRSESAPRLFDECVDICRKENLGDRVKFLGKRSDIPNVLSSLDVFVLSTLREGSPISVIEAMMMGVPTVLSDIPALREVSNDGRCAVLFRNGDYNDLAHKLLAIAGDNGQQAALSSRALAWANEQFGIDRHISDLIKLYESLCSSSQSLELIEKW